MKYKGEKNGKRKKRIRKRSKKDGIWRYRKKEKERLFLSTVKYSLLAVSFTVAAIMIFAFAVKNFDMRVFLAFQRVIHEEELQEKWELPRIEVRITEEENI